MSSGCFESPSAIPVVAGAFGDVADLLASPQHVMGPRILWRVLRGNLGRRSGEGDARPHEQTQHDSARAIIDPAQQALRKAVLREMGKRAAATREHAGWEQGERAIREPESPTQTVNETENGSEAWKERIRREPR